MGGHGGLNILPQKRWNVYNYENREKVRRDEEAAAREEQLKREQSRRREAEFRLERLRQARSLPPSSSAPVPASAQVPSPAAAAPALNDSRHFNLFDGVADFSAVAGTAKEADARDGKRFRKQESEGGGSGSGSGSNKRRRGEEKETRVVAPEDEKYKLGYGLVGKGVKAPWYLSRPSEAEASPESRDEEIGRSMDLNGPGKSKSGGKKTIEQLREERMRREKQEHKRERSILASVEKKSADRGFSRCHK